MGFERRGHRGAGALDHFWKWPEGWQLERVVSPFFDSVIEDYRNPKKVVFWARE